MVNTQDSNYSVPESGHVNLHEIENRHKNEVTSFYTRVQHRHGPPTCIVFTVTIFSDNGSLFGLVIIIIV